MIDLGDTTKSRYLKPLAMVWNKHFTIAASTEPCLQVAAEVIGLSTSGG